MMTAGVLKYRNSILRSIQEQREDFSDVVVICADGNIKVQGLVLASLLPCLKLGNNIALDECCVLLPDVSKDHLETFVQSLFGVSIKHLREALKKNPLCLVMNLKILILCIFEVSIRKLNQQVFPF